MRIKYINAKLIDKNSCYDGCLVTDGAVIVYVGPESNCNLDNIDSVIDVEGKALMPAFIDMHCHLRDPGFTQKETLETGMRAAISGGYTTLCAMANTNPPCTKPEMIEENQRKAKQLKLCRLIQCAGAGEHLSDEVPTDYESLSRCTPIISNDGNTIFSDKFMSDLLVASTRYGFLISTHCQPERQIVKRDLALLRRLGGNLHVGHISRKETVEMIREAKSQGLSLTCEVTPHHLFGTDMDYKVNPPIRTKEDVEELIKGINDGTVDCLSTDHAPHTPEDKQRGAAGISNIEFAMQMYMQVFYENNISLKKFSELASYNPARILHENAGLLKSGYVADLVVVNTEYEGVIDVDKMISKSHNNPFNGRKIRGKVLKTIREGELIYDNGQFV